MSKIIINLNPKKERVSSEVLQNVVAYTPLAILAAAVFLILVLGLQIVSLKKMHTNSVYNKKWAQWEQKYKSIQAIKMEIANLENENNDLQKVTTPKYKLEAIFGDIFAALPRNIWFNNLNFDKGTLTLKGSVASWGDNSEDYLVSLDKFINSLREKNYFSSKFNKININESQKNNFNGIEVLEFAIECKS